MPHAAAGHSSPYCGRAALPLQIEENAKRLCFAAAERCPVQPLRLTDAAKTGCAVSRTETGAVQPSVRGLGAGGPSWDCSRQTAISVNWSAIAVSSAASMLRSSFDRFSAAAAAIAADTYTICSIPYGMPAVPRPVPRYEHSSAGIAGGAVCLSFAPLLQDPAHGGSVLARAGSEQRTDQKAQVADQIQA